MASSAPSPGGALDPRPLPSDETSQGLIANMLNAFGQAGAPPFRSVDVVRAIMPFHAMAGSDLADAIQLLHSMDRAQSAWPPQLVVASPPPAAAAAGQPTPSDTSRYMRDPRGGISLVFSGIGGVDPFGRDSQPPNNGESEAVRKGRFNNLPIACPDAATGNCAVCLEPLRSGEAGELKALLCQHVFHKECAWEWLKGNNTCPVCRFETL